MSPHSTDRNVAETVLPLLGETDDVTLRVGDECERDTRNPDRLLHDPTAEVLHGREARLDVVDADEEGHQLVVAALKRPDATGNRLHAGLDVAVPRERALGIGPSEQF